MPTGQEKSLPSRGARYRFSRLLANNIWFAIGTMLLLIVAFVGWTLTRVQAPGFRVTSVGFLRPEDNRPHWHTSEVNVSFTDGGFDEPHQRIGHAFLRVDVTTVPAGSALEVNGVKPPTAVMQSEPNEDHYDLNGNLESDDVRVWQDSNNRGIVYTLWRHQFKRVTISFRSTSSQQRPRLQTGSYTLATTSAMLTNTAIP